MVDIEQFRKRLREDLKYYWENIQIEINKYFEIIYEAKVDIENCKRKLIKTKKSILKDFYLDEEKLKDPFYLPEIYNLLYYLKENNFNCFNRDSYTKDYDHYQHGYELKSILSNIESIVKKIEKFRSENFIELLNERKEISSESNFIYINFENYGLHHYQSFIDLINSIAYHETFYKVLPYLLRCLFENLLHDVISDSLNDQHTLLYYNDNNRRIRSFSLLIELLNLLGNSEYKPYVKDKINEKIIQYLKEIRDDGNYNVHDIIQNITKDYTEEIKEKVHTILDTLLVTYKKVYNRDIKISNEREIIIKRKLGIINQTKKNNKKISNKKDLGGETNDLYQELIEFLNYISSDSYLKNQDSIDQKINFYVKYFKDNEKEFRKLFGFDMKNEQSNKFDKEIYLLKGRYTLFFRNHTPYQSMIQKKGRVMGPFDLKSNSELLNLLKQELKKRINKLK